MIEVDSGQLGVDSAMAEPQQLQTALTTPDRNNWWWRLSVDRDGGIETRVKWLAAGTPTTTASALSN